jgi:hypothetical protein
MAECFKAPFTTTCRSTSRRFAIPTRMDARRARNTAGTAALNVNSGNSLRPFPKSALEL